MKEFDDKNRVARRTFLKTLGAGALASTAALVGCTKPNKVDEEYDDAKAYTNKVPEGSKMTYRTNPHTGDKVSILGYGMMRLPNKPKETPDSPEEIDQEQVNRLVDFALEHGVNYFDTSPAYCRGGSEAATGIALARHNRKDFFIATKLSNFAEQQWSFEESVKMYHNSMKYLQTDYIDYLLLHAVGGSSSAGDGMATLRARYIDNGVLDFLLKEREAGRIRNLGFSYHGDIEVFNYLLSQNDKYHWDFVQIQMNYVDWTHSKDINPRNTNGDYLYGELQKLGIPGVIMEPLLGGRLSHVPNHVVAKLKQRDPEASVASWAFRFAGSPEGILTVLSGMTYMEHLQDNLRSYCPLKPLNDEEKEFLDDVAGLIAKYQTIQCNDCKYCMPCPYGLDIPAIFVHYNKCINEDNMPHSLQDPNYERDRKIFLVGYDRSVPKLRQASHCIGCNQCVSHCPQSIRIPQELRRIDEFVEKLKQNTL